MVNFNGTFLRASEVAAVEIFETGDPEYPKGLKVKMKDGSQYGVRYQSEERRNRDKFSIISEIDREDNLIREKLERSIDYLQILRGDFGRMEKRQLKMQRIIKAIFEKSEGRSNNGAGNKENN